MKVHVVLLGSAILLLAALGAWAQEKYVATADEELYGPWTNRRTVQDTWHPQKLVITAEGYKNYVAMSDTESLEEGTMEIESKWTDSEGNIVYKVFGVRTKGYFTGYKFQNLVKISDSGKVAEWVSRNVGLKEFDPSRYPIKVDPKDPTYDILYRVEE